MALSATGRSDAFGISKVLNTIKQGTLDALAESKPDETVEKTEKKLKAIKDFQQEIKSCLAPIK
jgi:hypothetical protein